MLLKGLARPAGVANTARRFRRPPLRWPAVAIEPPANVVYNWCLTRPGLARPGCKHQEAVSKANEAGLARPADRPSTRSGETR